jgi:uncharacterized protein (DUF2141 family)
MYARIKCLLVIGLSFFWSFTDAQTINVVIKDIRNTKGQLCLAIFADEAGFKSEKTCWNMKCLKKDIVKGEFHIQIPFRCGEWGFSVLDDENNNGKMEYNLIGMPREGFGFSNFYLTGLHRPVFKDFSFKIIQNETKTVIVRMKYL